MAGVSCAVVPIGDATRAARTIHPAALEGGYGSTDSTIIWARGGVVGTLEIYETRMTPSRAGKT